jgi:hypothetical protein
MTLIILANNALAPNGFSLWVAYDNIVSAPKSPHKMARQ